MLIGGQRIDLEIGENVLQDRCFGSANAIVHLFQSVFNHHGEFRMTARGDNGLFRFDRFRFLCGIVRCCGDGRRNR